jgi:hypothetical protein
MQLVFGKNKNVIWMDSVQTGERPVYYISDGKIFYRLTYHHKNLYVSFNIYKKDESTAGVTEHQMDEIIKNHYRKPLEHDPKFSMIENLNKGTIINLTEYFKKGFFYKGMKYNYEEYVKKYYSQEQPWGIPKKEITNLVNVSTENGLFHLEIVNNTYPHTGYAYLDINTLKIVDTKIVEE